MSGTPLGAAALAAAHGGVLWGIDEEVVIDYATLQQRSPPEELADPEAEKWLVGGLAAQNQTFGGGCSLLVPQHVAGVFLAGTASAQIRVPVPIPNDPALRGLQFVAQAAVLDSARSPIGSLTATGALRITIGD